MRREPGLSSFGCVFCAAIATGENIVSRQGSAVALLDRYPVADGHRLVIPRRHVEQLFDLSTTEVADIWRLLKRLRKEIASRDDDVLGFNVGVNVGEVAGQTVPHAHVHLIPRRRGDTPDPRGGVRGVIPGRMGYEIARP